MFNPGIMSICRRIDNTLIKLVHYYSITIRLIGRYNMRYICMALLVRFNSFDGQKVNGHIHFIFQAGLLSILFFRTIIRSSRYFDRYLYHSNGRPYDNPTYVMINHRYMTIRYRTASQCILLCYD